MAAMLKHSQVLGLHQKLSPQLIQSQLLLAIPTMALEQEIKLQLEANPLLEETVEEPDEIEQQQDSEINDNLSEDGELPEKDTGEETYDIDEWYDYSDLDLDGYKSPEEFDKQKQKEIESKTEYAINRQVRLKESPLDQLYRSGLDEKYILIGEEIIGSLADDGYLRDPLEDILNDLKKSHAYEFTLEDVENVLKIIQKFDPVGIASRNLQECLSVQIEELGLDDETKHLCLEMINKHFNDFKARHFEKLSKNMNISLEKVNELFEIVHKLNPIPGHIESSPERNYIYPDFIVKVIEGEIIVELTNDYLPSLRISKKYLELYKTRKTPKQTREFLKDKLDSAKWFISSIMSRRQTMLKVMKAIVNRQRKFFLTEGENLKPMFEKDIASDIGMDVSTISRTVRNKYVQTDFGIYELRFFFSNAIQTESGEDVSSKIVKEKLRGIISNEDKIKPLSDDKITKMMAEAGFPIARRTVAKYREAMKIPKASLRREINLDKA